MTTPHPMFISIFRAYGVAPADEEEEIVCSRCRVRMACREEAEGCEDHDCPMQESDQ